MGLAVGPASETIWVTNLERTLIDIVVRPEFRGRGLGRAITRALMDWGRRQGAETAYLQVFDGNRVALALYESLNFRSGYAYHYRRRALT